MQVCLWCLPCWLCSCCHFLEQARLARVVKSRRSKSSPWPDRNQKQTLVNFQNKRRNWRRPTRWYYLGRDNSPTTTNPTMKILFLYSQVSSSTIAISKWLFFQPVGYVPEARYKKKISFPAKMHLRIAFTLWPLALLVVTTTSQALTNGPVTGSQSWNRTINVPFVKQPNDYTCGPTSLLMLMGKKAFQLFLATRTCWRERSICSLHLQGDWLWKQW